MLNASQKQYIRDLNSCGYGITTIAKIATYAFNQLVFEDEIIEAIK